MRDKRVVPEPAARPHGFEKHWPKILVALTLTFASGLVDIIGYLGVFHLFTAHLTGTTVQLGRSLISHNWIDLLSAAVIVGSFVSGSILGRAVIEAGSRKRIRRIASVTLAMEAILLAYLAETAFHSAANGAAEPYWALSLLAGAMGIQTATLTGIGPLTVHTTFVTGMINKLAQLISHIAFRAYDVFRKRRLGAKTSRSLGFFRSSGSFTWAAPRSGHGLTKNGHCGRCSLRSGCWQSESLPIGLCRFRSRKKSNNPNASSE